MTRNYRLPPSECTEVFWHGSPSGNLKGGTGGLHLGTCKAATEALEARIGRPIEGTWDGTREYGKTLLWGKETFKAHGELPTGYNADAFEAAHYPSGRACYSDGSCVSMTSKPEIRAYKIKGCMSNNSRHPLGDTKANAMMKGNLKRGTAKCGYYYINEAEDEGSVSAVVPDRRHIESLSLVPDLCRCKTTY